MQSPCAKRKAGVKENVDMGNPVMHDTHPYSMPPLHDAGKRAKRYLQRGSSLEVRPRSTSSFVRSFGGGNSTNRLRLELDR